MAGPYKALTYVHLPVIEKDFAPGDMISDEDLEAAGQEEENIQALVEGGALGGEDDPLDPSSIIPDPNMPTIASVVEETRASVADMKERGDEIPPELQAVADLDYRPVSANDEAAGGDKNA